MISIYGNRVANCKGFQTISNLELIFPWKFPKVGVPKEVIATPLMQGRCSLQCMVGKTPGPCLYYQLEDVIKFAFRTQSSGSEYISCCKFPELLFWHWVAPPPQMIFNRRFVHVIRELLGGPSKTLKKSTRYLCSSLSRERTLYFATELTCDYFRRYFVHSFWTITYSMSSFKDSISLPSKVYQIVNSGFR